MLDLESCSLINVSVFIPARGNDRLGTRPANRQARAGNRIENMNKDEAIKVIKETAEKLQLAGSIGKNDHAVILIKVLKASGLVEIQPENGGKLLALLTEPGVNLLNGSAMRQALFEKDDAGVAKSRQELLNEKYGDLI